jgi:hypothetical protein
MPEASLNQLLKTAGGRCSVFTRSTLVCRQTPAMGSPVNFLMTQCRPGGRSDLEAKQSGCIASVSGITELI